MLVRPFLLLPLAWTLLAAPGAFAAEPVAAPSAVVDPAAPFISDADWERNRTAAPSATTAAPAPAGKAVAAMVGSLALVLALAVAAVFLLRRFARRRPGPASGRHLELVETVHLGVKRSVAVLRLGDHLILVGQSEQGLSGLGSFPASALTPPTADRPASAPLPAASGPSAFSTLLGTLTGKRR